jgi:hypothetical protein
LTPDPFGNLRDWGPVLETLEELAHNGRLDECQDGLVRILRYPGNWRLREKALEQIPRIARPSPPLMNQVLHIAADDNLYFEVRILAVRALGSLIAQHRRLSSPPPAKVEPPVTETLRRLRSVPQPPRFQQALDACLHELAP